MKNLLIIATVATAFLVVVPCHSQHEKAAPALGFEISPSIGFIGASPAIGLEALINYSVVGLSLSLDQAWGKTTTFYPLSVNLQINLGEMQAIQPYAVLGGGMFLTVPKLTVDAKTVTSLGFSFGGGFKYLWSKKVGFYFEGKQMFTEVENRVHIKELFVFFHNRIGIIFRI